MASRIRARVAAQGRKFSKVEAIYFAGLDEFFSPRTGLGLNVYNVDPANIGFENIKCSTCVFWQPPNRCEVVGLSLDFGGENIAPEGLSRFYVAKQPTQLTRTLSAYYLPDL